MNGTFIKGIIRVFVFAFLGALVPLLTGLGAAPDWNTAKALAVSAIFASGAIAVKAVVDFLTKGVTPVPSAGILPNSIKN